MMKKFLLFLFLFFFLAGWGSAQTLADYNFKGEKEELEWQKVFNISGTVEDFLLMRNLVDIRQGDGSMNALGVFEKKEGEKSFLFIDDGYYFLDLRALRMVVFVDVKDDRYRVTLSGIRVNDVGPVERGYFINIYGGIGITGSKSEDTGKLLYRCISLKKDGRIRTKDDVMLVSWLNDFFTDRFSLDNVRKGGDNW